MTSFRAHDDLQPGLRHATISGSAVDEIASQELLEHRGCIGAQLLRQRSDGVREGGARDAEGGESAAQRLCEGKGEIRVGVWG